MSVVSKKSKKYFLNSYAQILSVLTKEILPSKDFGSVLLDLFLDMS